MAEAKKEFGLNTICEVISEAAIEAAVKYVDMLQIGARNMQNFQLLREAGRSGMPILLKRDWPPPLTSGSTLRNTSLRKAIPTWCSANAASVLTRQPPATHWI